MPAGKGLVNGVVFGLPVYGVHPETLDRLEQAQQFLGARRSAGTGARGWGVQSIGGYRANSRGHSRGLAVDINYYANPYVMHESGEAEQDARLAPVYHRIARLMLKRDSVIPARITQGAISERRTLQLFRALRNESRAMTGYFRLMRNRAQLERHLPSAPKPAKGLSARFGVPNRALVAAALQRRMLADYVLLAGRPGPAVPGLQYPAPDPALAGDAPFTGDPKLRAPELGFLNLPEELVRTLTAVGFRWGGTDMGRQSGDLMHFYLPEQAVNLRPSTPSKPAAKKKE